MVSKLDTPRDDLRNLVLTYSDRVSPTKTKVKRRGSSGLKLSACAEIVLTGEEKSVDTTQCPLKRVCGSCICTWKTSNEWHLIFMLNVINIIILLYKVLSLTWSASHNQRASLPSGEKNERKRKTASLKVAYWNTRTMQDPEDRPQRHLVLLARELARLDIDIAALSEVRFAEQGSLTVSSGLLVREERGRALPLWCRLHDQNFHCQMTAELAGWALWPPRVPKTPNPGQQVCHCPQCVCTNSAAWNWNKRGLLPRTA